MVAGDARRGGLVRRADRRAGQSQALEQLVELQPAEPELVGQRGHRAGRRLAAATAGPAAEDVAEDRQLGGVADRPDDVARQGRAVGVAEADALLQRLPDLVAELHEVEEGQVGGCQLGARQARELQRLQVEVELDGEVDVVAHVDVARDRGVAADDVVGEREAVEDVEGVDERLPGAVELEQHRLEQPERAHGGVLGLPDHPHADVAEPLQPLQHRHQVGALPVDGVERARQLLERPVDAVHVAPGAHGQPVE